MLETHYPGGHQTGGLRGRLPFGGGAGPAAPRRHRVRTVPDRPDVTRNGRRRTGKRETLRSPFFIPDLHPARKRPGSERQRTTGNGKKHRPRGRAKTHIKRRLCGTPGPAVTYRKTAAGCRPRSDSVRRHPERAETPPQRDSHTSCPAEEPRNAPRTRQRAERDTHPSPNCR